jgi:cellulose synthase/poly-beta-1,6-N-acetylglucosamine synthase-like glycosyltransferase
MWQFVFWLCIGLVLYSYFGYPLVLALLRRRRRRRPLATDGVDYPPLCLIISAFNEERVIRKKIENSLELEYPRDRYMILVASDGSNDDTVRIVQEYAEHGVHLVHSPERRGKSEVLNQVLPNIDAEIVVFTDANSMFEPDALEKLARHFSDDRIGCVVGKLRYIDRQTTSVGKGEGLYWKYEGVLSRLESSIGRVLVANGSIFAARRRLCGRLHPAVANDQHGFLAGGVSAQSPYRPSWIDGVFAHA